MERMGGRDGAQRLKPDLGASPTGVQAVFYSPTWTPTWLPWSEWPASPLAAGRHTAPGTCYSPPQPCRLWADWPWATVSLWAPTTPPLPRLPPAMPHPHSRQCRPAPAHTLVLPTLHLRAGCAGEPPILPVPAFPPVQCEAR